jgi:Flp pilus assembly protein TadG
MPLIGGLRRRRRRARGQALVEFTLVIPIFMLIVVAIAEFSFFLTIKIGVTNTAQDAVQYASELGSVNAADYQVLQLIEQDVSSPMNKAKIVTVEFIQTDSYGTANLGEDKYTRGGVYVNPDNAAQTVPYSQDSTGYLPATRCNTIAAAACGGVDYIAVRITYQYTWVTPLPSLIGFASSAPQFVETSVSRLEPIQ